jgi:hypothetical protein
VTLFHKPSNPASTRILTLLRQTSATANTTATEDQASDHDAHSNAQIVHAPFDLDVVEGPPTDDQLRNIIQYVGERNADSVVPGAEGAADAARRLRKDMNAFRRPLVSVLPASEDYADGSGGGLELWQGCRGRQSVRGDGDAQEAGECPEMTSRY